MLKQIGQYAFSHKKTVTIALVLCVIGISGVDYAQADTAATGTSLTSSGIYLAVFIVAGVVWSLSGYINNIRNHANYEKAHPAGPKDPDWNGFDTKAMKDDVFIGLILGVIAFATNATTSIPDISTASAFLAALIPAYGLIGLSDKIFVGAILNK